MKVYFISLGCDKNLVDSEVMLGALAKNGFEITDNEDEAEAVVLNTCCFIHDAKEESINAILEMAELKKKGVLRWIIVSGCLAERYRDEIISEIPEVDALVGTTAYDGIAEVLGQLVENENERQYLFRDINYLPAELGRRMNTTGGYYSYLKISEGCDKHCTYCIIPSLRGGYRSTPMEQLVMQAEELAKQGVRELILVGQETTVYGVDIYGRKMLSELLRRLCALEGIKWIRLLYCYPEEIDDELIETIRSEEKVCNYLDMPIQHADDEILKRMGRRTSRAQLEELIARLRARIEDISLRTSLITGFPGETDEQHEALIDFVGKMRFDRLGVFTYSKEEGTAAAKMKGQITKTVKKKRQKELMLLQQGIAFEKAEKLVGKKLTVIVEGFIPDDEVYAARTYMDAPGVDGYIFVKSPAVHMSGDFINVRVTAAKTYDLLGEEII